MNLDKINTASESLESVKIDYRDIKTEDLNKKDIKKFEGELEWKLKPGEKLKKISDNEVMIKKPDGKINFYKRQLFTADSRLFLKGDELKEEDKIKIVDKIGKHFDSSGRQIENIQIKGDKSGAIYSQIWRLQEEDFKVPEFNDKKPEFKEIELKKFIESEPVFTKERPKNIERLGRRYVWGGGYCLIKILGDGIEANGWRRDEPETLSNDFRDFLMSKHKPLSELAELDQIGRNSRNFDFMLDKVYDSFEKKILWAVVVHNYMTPIFDENFTKLTMNANFSLYKINPNWVKESNSESYITMEKELKKQIVEKQKENVIIEQKKEQIKNWEKEKQEFEKNHRIREQKKADSELNIKTYEMRKSQYEKDLVEREKRKVEHEKKWIFE